MMAAAAVCSSSSDHRRMQYSRSTVKFGQSLDILPWAISNGVFTHHGKTSIGYRCCHIDTLSRHSQKWPGIHWRWKYKALPARKQLIRRHMRSIWTKNELPRLCEMNINLWLA